MTCGEQSRQVRDVVQIDDGCLGGGRNRGKPQRGSQNKQVFAIAVETD